MCAPPWSRAGRTQEGMSTERNRVDAGVPTGGQFAKTTHSDTVPALDVPAAKTATEHFASYFESEALISRHREQAESLDKVHQIQSLRCLAAGILAKHPDAATLQITENEDGENQFDLVSVTAADGTILEGDEIDEDWGEETPFAEGPDLQGLLYALDRHDDSWADGVAEFNTTNRKYTRTANIDLKAAMNAPLPPTPQNDPLTRAFTADEQSDLIEAANNGVLMIQDRLDEGHHDPGAAEELESLLARVNILLTNTAR